ASEGIRATVIGASQYTTQVSGSTIYVSPLEALPLRNVPVIAPAFALDGDDIDSAAVAAEIKALLKRLDLDEAGTPAAVFLARLGHLPAARRVLPGPDRWPRGDPRGRPPAGARGRRRCRRPHGGPSAGGNAARQRGRLSRWPRNQRVRLHRYRHPASRFAARAG